MLEEKKGHVKNPMTVIAIFAAVAEISGTTVLPFITEQNQELYIWFLMCFPLLLVITFFLTLNFNRDALYAPSDYRDEKNFVFHRVLRDRKNRGDKEQTNSFDEIKSILEKLKQEDNIDKLHGEIQSVKEKVDEVGEYLNDPISKPKRSELIIDLGDAGQGLIGTKFNPKDEFQILLNSIYFDFLDGMVNPFSYGEEWQLVEVKTGKAINKLGSRDARSLSKAGFSRGETYRIEFV